MRISDWSSDVCSSDLNLERNPSVSLEEFRGGMGDYLKGIQYKYADNPIERRRIRVQPARGDVDQRQFLRPVLIPHAPPPRDLSQDARVGTNLGRLKAQNGRESCRERGCP